MIWTRRFVRNFLPLGLAFAAQAAAAQSLDVALGQTVTVATGEVYDAATVRNGGTLVLEGGAIGTNATPSVLVEAGGRFIFNSGNIRYFENHGVAELYGGRQSTDSSENRGYVKYAGGDPGFQLVHFDGTVDVYYTATNRTAWEIDSTTTNGSPQIRFFSVSNSLAAGSYTYATLVPASYYGFGKVYHDAARFWTPSGTQLVAQIDVSIASNWPGKVWSYKYSGPLSPTVVVRPAVEISWNAQSGRTYQVQTTTDLVAGAWRNLGTPILSQDTNAAAFDSMPDSNKTYRVLLRH